MNENDIRQLISEKAGIPKELIQGKTNDEILTYARNLIAFKEKHSDDFPDTRDIFANWFDDIRGIERPNYITEAYKAIDDISESIRISQGGYPIVKDGGNPYINGKKQPDPRQTRDIFAEWIAQKIAFDPRKDDDGWISIT